MHGVFEESLVLSMTVQPILHASIEKACKDRHAAL